MTRITGELDAQQEQRLVERALAEHHLLDDGEVLVTAERLQLTKVRGRTYTLDWLRTDDLETDLGIAMGRLVALISASERSLI